MSERDNDTWLSEKGRAKHIVRILGPRVAAELTVKHVDDYRTRRLGEKTVRGVPPAPATLDKEVELLKRMLNYAVTCGSLKSNPIGAAKLLRKANVRRSVLDDLAFEKLFAAAEPALRPILLVAYDTGMRLREVLGLNWSQVDLKAGVVKLAAQDTKTEEPRTVFLTSRVREALASLPRYLKSDSVFTNPQTRKAWNDIRKMFHRAQRGGPHRNLVPRPATQLRDQRAPAWRAGVGGHEDVGASHQVGLRPVQHRRRGRPPRCHQAHRGGARDRRYRLWTRSGQSG